MNQETVGLTPTQAISDHLACGEEMRAYQFTIHMTAAGSICKFLSSEKWFEVKWYQCCGGFGSESAAGRSLPNPWKIWLGSHVP
jgi:hypothetical protein